MGRLSRIAKEIRREMKFKRVTAVRIPASSGAKFSGHLALVTGGSSGIGLEIARSLAAEGCDVVVAGRHADRVGAAVEQISKVGMAKGLELDVSDAGSLSAKVEEAASLYPNHNGIDILVNSAGVSVYRPFGQVDEAAYDAVLDTNLKGTFFVTQAVANHMIERDVAGHILNVSSSSALRPAKSPYEVSKWGVKGMTLGFAEELIQFGIVVNAIAPGPTATPLLSKDGESNLLHVQNPTGRMAHPAEIANLALVLLGSGADLVVGDTLYATGGAGTFCIDR